MGKNDQIEGQMSLFDFLEAPSAAVEAPKEQQLRINIPWPCRECKWHDGCCCEYDKKPEEYGECKLFVSRTPDFDTMGIEDAAERIGKELGLEFKEGYRYDDGSVEYRARFKKINIEIHFSHYTEGIHGARRFLALDITNDQHEGYGGPCESIEEAIREIRKRVKGLEQDKTDTEKKSPICRFSEHTCNKEELWRVAEEIGEDCSRTCCRSCDNYNCGARCNGAPKTSRIEKMIEAQSEDSKSCWDCINWIDNTCLINSNYARYHKYDDERASLPRCENRNRFYPKSMSHCELKDKCDDYPLHCKGECFWCHKNPNLRGDNCLNCRKYKIECFPEHAAVHGKCDKYKQVPDFYRVMRCQLCKYWTVSKEQPPAGWGVKGYCELEESETNASSGCCYFERGENKDEQMVDET